MDSNHQKRAFLDFLDQVSSRFWKSRDPLVSTAVHAPQGDHMHHVETMLKQGGSRLVLSLDELRSFDSELARALRSFEPHMRTLRYHILSGTRGRQICSTTSRILAAI